MGRTIYTSLLVALVVVACLEAWHRSQRNTFSQSEVESVLAANTADKAQPRQGARALDEGIEWQESETFAFDPNTADTTALLRLGFPRWMIRSMLRYRASGGRYGDVEDLKRIPGMRPEIYERLAPYVRIDERFKPYGREEAKAKVKVMAGGDTAKWVDKLGHGEMLDLNTADSAALCLVPGIGSYRARLIVSRRARLGGFVDVRQLREIEDIPDSCADWFVIGDTAINRININTASLSALRRHPYIGTYRAAAIVDWRNERGPISDLRQLSLHRDFTDNDIKRLERYVCY